MKTNKSVCIQVWHQVIDLVDDQVEGQVWDQFEQLVEDKVWVLIHWQVRLQVTGQVSDQIKEEERIKQ